MTLVESLHAQGPGQAVDVDQAALRVTLDVIGLVGAAPCPPPRLPWVTPQVQQRHRSGLGPMGGGVRWRGKGGGQALMRGCSRGYAAGRALCVCIGGGGCVRVCGGGGRLEAASQPERQAGVSTLMQLE